MGRLGRSGLWAGLAVSALLAAAVPAAASAHAWRVTETSTLPGTLNAVGCAPRFGCEVVGYPAFGPQPRYGRLDAVTCGQFGCVAVGGSIYGFRAARETSAGWERMPLKGPLSLYGETLEGVACTSRVSCLAVGNADALSRVDCPANSPSGQNCLTSLPVLERWNGREWTMSPPLPVPAIAVTAVPVASDQPYSTFSDVACAPTRSCVVIGQAWEPGIDSPREAFADTSNRARWTLAPIPWPVGTNEAELSAVSCSRSRCLAVGSAILDGRPLPFAAEQVGGHWSDIDPALSSPGSLEVVSCVSSGACVAVGYQGAGSAGRPLIERWAGGRWARESAPIPLGSRRRGGSTLVGVSCVSATSCEAVGNYDRFTNQGLSFGWFIERGAA